jgi:predicted amidohydrolase
MTRSVRVSALQLSAVIAGRTPAERRRANLREIQQLLRVAGQRRSDLVLAGEYVSLYHRTWSTDPAEYLPEKIPGPFTRAVAVLARRYAMNVVLPVFGTYRGVLSSWAVVIDRKGRIPYCYQKSHPTSHEQRLGIRAGADLPVFPLDCARIGIMICMDIEYPEVAQTLMLRGADILLFPHVQGSWGEPDWEVRYRARAVDTGLYLLSACYGYAEGEWTPGKMIGRTSVVGRDGLILADMGRGVGVLTHDLDLERGRVTEFYFEQKLPRTLAVRASRRPELYGDLADTRLRDMARKEINNTR